MPSPQYFSFDIGIYMKLNKIIMGELAHSINTFIKLIFTTSIMCYRVYIDMLLQDKTISSVSIILYIK